MVNTNANWKYLEEWIEKQSPYKVFKHEGKIYGRILVLVAGVGKYYRTYVTERWKEHFYIKEQAFGISADIFCKFEWENVETIFIRYHSDTEGIIWYSASLETWMKGFQHVDEQTGENQVMLRVKDMAEIKEKEK